MALTIIVRGAPNTGKTTAARLIQLALEEAGYADVVVKDAPPVRTGKGEFQERWAKNKLERVAISVEVLPADACPVCGRSGPGFSANVNAGCRWCGR